MSTKNLNITTTGESSNVVSVITEDRSVNIVSGGKLTTINLSQSEASTIELTAFAPQGPMGPQGPQGPKGDAGDADLSTLATTGSNTFVGNQTITGSVDISGSLTVNTVNVGQNTLNFIDDSGNIVNSLSIVSGTTNISIATGSIQTSPEAFFSGSFTGSLFGTASYATTASYALFAANGGGGSGAGFPYSGSAVITGSLLVTNGITGSFSGSVVGYVPNTATSSFITNSQTSSFVTTSSFNSFTSSINSFTSSINNWTGSVILNTQTGSMLQPYLLSSQTGSMLQPYLLSNQTSSMTVGTASYYAETDPIYNAEKGKYLTTGSYGTTQTISGSLIIDQNLTVLGSQSIQYITSSQLNISTNLITVNTATPAVRFGGLAVYDSGSTGKTGSILWDSEHNVWIYTNPSGASYDGGMLLVGPRSTTIGNEVGINEWYAAVGNGSHHMTSSLIWNSGSLIRLETNTEVTGSLIVSAGITGSLEGTASWATNFVSASDYLRVDNTGSMLQPYLLSNQTGSFITNEQTSSFVLNSQTSSMTVGTASFYAYTTTAGLRVYTEDFYITAGSKGYRHIGYDSTIIKVRSLANTNGNIIVDVRRNGTNLGTVTLLNQSASLDTTLTGWTRQLNENDLIEFYVSQSSTYITDISIYIDIQKR